MQSELFNCIVCTFEFDRDDHIPKMLGSCGHTVCSECLDHLLKTKTPVCPLDRIPIPETPQKSSEGYPTNIILLQLIEEKQKKGYDVCINHREPNTLVCLTHKCRICHYCANYGEHMKHPTKTIEIVQSEANNKRDRIEAQIRHFDSIPKLTEKLIEDTRNPLLGATKEQFNKIREALNKKKEEIRAEIGLFYAQEVNKVDYKVEKAMTTGEDPFNVGEHGRFNKDEESKAILNIVQTQDAKFDMQLKNLYSSFVSLVQNFRPIIPEENLRAENGEELYNKCAKVKNVLKLQEINDVLVIAPREEVKEREYSEVTDIHYSKSRKVVFDFTRTRPSEQILQAIFYISDQLGEIYSLKVDFSNSGITEQELMAFYFNSFWAAPWLRDFDIDLEGCNVGSEALIKMMGQTIMKTPGLKSLAINFSNTRIIDKSLKVFITTVVPLIANLTKFKLNLTQTQVSDGMLTDLCERMKGVVSNLQCFDLDLSQTETSDQLVKAFTKHTLPTFTALEYFALSLHLTKATDKSIKPLCTSMKGVMDKVKSFSLGLSTNVVTDASILAFSEHTLPSMTQLSDKFIMNVSGKDVTNQGINALFNRMDCLMTNIKIFDLQLWHTSVSDSIFRAFEEKVIPSLVAVTSFRLSLRATSVGDEGVHHLFRNLKKIGKNLKSLGLDISRINISDRPLEVLTKRLIPTLGGLESFEFNVTSTSLTDASVVPFCTAMKWWVKHLKELRITLNNVRVTDASANALVEYLQLVKPSLREVGIRLENTRISDPHREAINKLKQEIANKSMA